MTLDLLNLIKAFAFEVAPIVAKVGVSIALVLIISVFLYQAGVGNVAGKK